MKTIPLRRKPDPIGRRHRVGAAGRRPGRSLMPAGVVYVESSAVLAWLLGESSEREVRAAMDGADRVATSALPAVECSRALTRARLLGRITRVEELAALQLLQRAGRGVGRACAHRVGAAACACADAVRSGTHARCAARRHDGHPAGAHRSARRAVAGRPGAPLRHGAGIRRDACCDGTSRCRTARTGLAPTLVRWCNDARMAPRASSGRSPTATRPPPAP